MNHNIKLLVIGVLVLLSITGTAYIDIKYNLTPPIIWSIGVCTRIIIAVIYFIG